MRLQRATTMLLCSAILALGLGAPTVSAQQEGGETSEETASEDGGEGGSEKSAEKGEKNERKKEEKKEEEKIDAHAELSRANQLAGRGALTRSIPHYEKVLRHAHDRYTSAHFNLGEVLRAKEEYARALIHYQAYINTGDDPATKEDAERAIDKVKASIWKKRLARLSVEVKPTNQSTIEINGFVVAENSGLDEMLLLNGEYTVRADAKDHHPDEKTVKLDHEGSASLSFDLTKKIFFGTVKVSVDQEGATVKFHPEELDNPRGPDEPVVKEAPIEEPVELETGKWLVEVTKPDFHRWVRYVQIQRDKESEVRVQLSKKLPEEIR